MRRWALLLASCVLVATASSAGAARNPLIPTPIGAAAAFHPPALSRPVAARREVAGLRCERGPGTRFGVHLELFARGRVVIVPAGIGVAPPWSRPRPHVVSGACAYAARTTTPTGVIEVRSGRELTLRDFFVVWGQPLGDRRLAGFRARPEQHVRAYVAGSRWHGAAGAIPLHRHAEIVLELGTYIPPHSTFLFTRGL
jgi:hypothetical protein